MGVVLEPLDLITRLHILECENKVIVNLGAGKCESPISSQVLKIQCKQLVNVEVFTPYFNALNHLTYTSPHTNHNTTIEAWLDSDPLPTADIVLMIDVLEHFLSPTAQDVLARVRALAQIGVLVWVPLGKCVQEPYDGNMYQKHLSTWNVEDFKSATDVEVFKGFHKHFEPPVDAAWVWYLK